MRGRGLLVGAERRGALRRFKHALVAEGQLRLELDGKPHGPRDLVREGKGLCREAVVETAAPVEYLRAQVSSNWSR